MEAVVERSCRFGILKPYMADPEHMLFAIGSVGHPFPGMVCDFKALLDSKQEQFRDDGRQA
jgi:tryptophan synthase beta subunit